MLAYKFRLDVFDGEKLILQGHETRVHEFPDAMDLVYAVLNVVTANSRSRSQIRYPATQAIVLPLLPSCGYGTETTVVITKLIAAG